MKKIFQNYFLLILTLGLLTSCGDLSREVDKNLNELKNKAESLDSLVNKEADKVFILDSIINRESEKVKKLDSLIERSASKLDSIVNDKMNQLKK
jgi:hypothetical protein